jgi:dolichol-phosphate mannosyltransferase
MRRERCVVCPVHDEGALLASFHRKLRKCYSGEIIFIDDGSRDGSGDFLDGVADERTMVLRHARRKGYGAALRTGFRRTLEMGYGKIVTIDADFQHNPDRIGAFFRGLRDCEVVLGSRYMKGTGYAKAPGVRLVINRYMAGLLRVLFTVEFSDPFCGYRGYRDSFLNMARLEEAGYGLGLEVLLEMIRTRASFKEIPVGAVYPHPGRSFLDGLDDPRRRLLYYLDVISRKKKGTGYFSAGA